MPPTTADTLDAPSPAAERFESFRARLTLLARVRIGRRLRGKLDPDDVVQETFLAAVAAADEFRGDGDAQTLAWLRAILESRVQKLVARYHTAARDIRRERPRRPGSSTATDPGPPAPHSTPSRAAQRREHAELVADALAALPDDYREVLVLRNIEGLTFSDIAARLGRSVGAVTMLWARAVRRFRLATPEHP